VSSRPPDAVAPPPGNPRFPLLDPLRAVAALCIVVTHTAGVSGFNAAHALGAWTARLDCGVAIFFVLSGFLLYRPFVAARLDARDRPRVARYARRRALRILPGYWTALVVVAVLLPHEAPGAFGPHWWMYFGLLQSWSSLDILGGLGVGWSLSVEAAFYVLLPV
jgi:peptidoglycan/LPS O-acetylase OafA/YrhL